MNKWEATAVMTIALGFCSMLMVMTYTEEKTKQYRIQYNCPK